MIDILIKAGDFELKLERTGHECLPTFKGEEVNGITNVEVLASAAKGTEATIRLEVINDEPRPEDFIRAVRDAGFFVIVERLGPVTYTEILPPKDIIKKHGTTVTTDV